MARPDGAPDEAFWARLSEKLAVEDVERAARGWWHYPDELIPDVGEIAAHRGDDLRETLKARVEIVDAYNHYCAKASIEARGRVEVKCRCPIPGHVDETPSASINVTKGVGFCYACWQKFDAFDLAAWHHELNPRTEFRELLRRMAGDWGVALPEDRVAPPVAAPDRVAPVSSTTPAGSPETSDDVPDPAAVEAFWSARPYLRHISQAAHARLVSRDALLHAVLARVAAFVPPELQLPPIIGGEAPLSYLVAVVGPPGVGKTAANKAAKALLPAPGDVPIADLTLGSGEGLVEKLFDVVEYTDDKGKLRSEKQQVRRNAFVYCDEGELLTALADRKGATLLSTLRTIFTGGGLGQANASKERSREVPEGEWAYGVVVGFQDVKAGDLLADDDGGTPQRFAWASALDRTLTSEHVEWPGLLPWKRPEHTRGVMREVKIAPEIREEIRAEHLAKMRGDKKVASLDAHRVLLKEKMAELLAILDGRTNVDADDWKLAGFAMAASDRERDRVVRVVNEKQAAKDQASADRGAHRKVVEVRAVETHRVTDAARSIAKKVWKSDTATTKRNLKETMSARQKEVFAEAFEYAVEVGWISAASEATHTGAESVLVARGTVKP